MPRPHTALLPLALASLLTLTPTPAPAASPRKACLQSCKTGQRSCTSAAREQLRTSRAACTGERAAKRACLKATKTVGKAGKRICRNFRRDCRRCCVASGRNCELPPEVPVFSGSFPMPDRRALETAPLPPGPGGKGFTLLDLPDGVFYFDPAARSPVSAAAECAAVMLACYDPTLRNRAGCFAGVPACATDTPWVGEDPMCCARACGERYQELRRQGLSGPRAFAAAIWEAPSCMPGLSP